jgi:hypothetical protein
MLCPSHSPLFGDPSNVQWRAQVMKLLILQFSSVSSHFLLLSTAAMLLFWVLQELLGSESSVAHGVILPHNVSGPLFRYPDCFPCFSSVVRQMLGYNSKGARPVYPMEAFSQHGPALPSSPRDRFWVSGIFCFEN